MRQYIYWNTVNYEMYKMRKENEVFKRVELNFRQSNFDRDYPINIENGNCIVPEEITSIGDKYFYQCTSLTNIQFPSTMIKICNCAFYKTNIKSITIPEGVTSTENGCFSCCTSLTSVELPSSLKIIGNDAFFNTSIQSVIIPEGVTLIGKKLFLWLFIIN